MNIWLELAIEQLKATAVIGLGMHALFKMACASIKLMERIGERRKTKKDT
jgi:hypothetical protein